MNVDLELELKISHGELPSTLTSRISFGSQSNGSNQQHMQHDGQGCTSPFVLRNIGSIDSRTVI